MQPASEAFHVTAEAPDAEGRVRLIAVGELDLATAPLLSAALAEQRVAEAPVLVDLASVTFMDSSGLKILVAAARDARENGWSFAVDPAVGSAVRAVFDVVDAGRVIPFAADGS